MNEERAKVLEMLAMRRINAVQASQLIEALGEEPLTNLELPAAQPLPSAQPLPIPQAERLESPNFTFDQIIELSEHEVDPSYLKELRDAGLTDLTVDQIIELSEHDIEPEYLVQLREAGLTDLTFKQIIELSERGVDPAYIKALQGGSNASWQSR